MEDSRRREDGGDGADAAVRSGVRGRSVRGAAAAGDAGRGRAVVRHRRRGRAPLPSSVRLPYPVDLSMQSLPSPVVQYGVDKVEHPEDRLLDHDEPLNVDDPADRPLRRLGGGEGSRATPSVKLVGTVAKLPAMSHDLRRLGRPGRRSGGAATAPVCDVKLERRRASRRWRPSSRTTRRRSSSSPTPRSSRTPAIRCPTGTIDFFVRPTVVFSVLQVASRSCYSSRVIYDVVIAGAGPAGVSTAVALVRRDPSLAQRIVVLDRATFPRAKPCGGGLTGHADEAMAALGLELDGAVGAVAARRGALLGLPPRRSRSASRCASSAATSSTPAWSRRRARSASRCARARR